MNNINISNIQRRKPRRSMLGTHRGYSIGFQLNDEPNPKTTENDQNTSTISISISNLTRKLPRKSMLGTRNMRRDSIFSSLPESSLNESLGDSTMSFTTNEISEAGSPPKTKLESIFSQEANDSFEENESVLMANENEESVLATTLMDNTVVEMNGGISRPEDDKTLLETTLARSEIEDLTLTDTLSMLNSIIEINTRCVNRCHKQIDDIRNEIEEKTRQTEEIINLKCRLMKKFDLSDSSPRKSVKTNSHEKPRSVSPICKTGSVNPKSIIELQSPVAAPSRQIIRELRSTIKFLKTPRSTRRSRPSTILTPHSMSFSIKSQFEKLLE